MAEQNNPRLEMVEKLKTAVENIDKKDFGLYFFAMDTKGNATAGVANIYEHVKTLRELGYNAQILHEKNDYQTVGSWLGQEYAELPHVSIEAQQLQVSAADFIIVPEVFANIIEQTSQMPAKTIVFCQSYDYIMEMLSPGKKWGDYRVDTAITTTTKQGDYIKTLFPNVKTEVIPVGISEHFTPSEKPKKPIIAVSTREQRDLVKLFKTFYLKYPHFKWVSFRDMRGLPREQFAEALKECCMSVWIDDISGFGTFPIESMKCDVPVIGKVPRMVPEWMEDNNGVWTHDMLNITDLIAQYLQAWMEDSEPQEVLGEMSKMKDKYTLEQEKTSIKDVYERIISERRTGLENQYKAEEAQLQTTTQQ